MTQISLGWDCDTEGDGYAWDQSQVSSFFGLPGNINPRTGGLIYWTDATLVPFGVPGISNPVDGLLNATLSVNTVTIDTGVAIVNGWMYLNDDTVDFDFAATPGNANATDLIVLQRIATVPPTSPRRTIRLARVQGAAGSEATLTQTQALWQTPQWAVPLDGAGLPTGLENRQALSFYNTGAQVKVEEIELTATAATLDFTGIPAFFDSLRFLCSIRLTGAALPVDAVQVTFNGDAGANYNRIELEANNTGVFITSAGGLGLNNISWVAPAGTAIANKFGQYTVDINHYTSTNFHKNITVDGGYQDQALAAQVVRTWLYGNWNNTAPITRVTYGTPFVYDIGTKIVLYGIV